MAAIYAAAARVAIEVVAGGSETRSELALLRCCRHGSTSAPRTRKQPETTSPEPRSQAATCKQPTTGSPALAAPLASRLVDCVRSSSLFSSLLIACAQGPGNAHSAR